MHERISEAQKSLLESSLESALADVPDFGERFYERLFRLHPEIRNLFTRPRDAQARHLLEGLSAITKHLGTKDRLDEFVQALAGVHLAYGVREEHYAWIGENLVAVLAEMAPSSWSSEHERAWRSTFELIEAEVRVALAGIGAARGRSEDGSPGPRQMDPFETTSEYLLLARCWRGGAAFSDMDLRRWRAFRLLVERLLRAPRIPTAKPKRRSLRVPTRMRVSFASGGERSTALLANVAEEGLFIATEEPLSAGTLLGIEIVGSHSERPTHVTGVVVWTRRMADEHGPPGMGVRLTELGRHQRHAMLRLVQQAVCLNLSTRIPRSSEA